MNPNSCTHQGCSSAPVAQYRQTKPGPTGEYTQAFFSCASHRHTDPVQAAGLHAANCTLFPCSCTPFIPPPDTTAIH